MIKSGPQHLRKLKEFLVLHRPTSLYFLFTLRAVKIVAVVHEQSRRAESIQHGGFKYCPEKLTILQEVVEERQRPLREPVRLRENAGPCLPLRPAVHGL